jgi:bacilysin biosynthesis protein BacA
MLKFSMELCYPQLDVKTLSVGTLGPKETSSEQTLNYLISQWKLQQISVKKRLKTSWT